jgi:hypothetical protein
MRFTALLLLLVSALPASAQRALAPGQEHQPRVERYARDFVNTWIGDLEMRTNVRASTDSHRKLDWPEARALDRSWRDEIADDKPDGLVDAVTNSALSRWLKDRMAEAPNGAVTEIYLIDGLGWNAAGTKSPSDFFQGDELQWQEVLPGGPNAIYVSELEDNYGKGRTLAIVSLPINVDSSNLGVVTLGVDVSKIP